ncbi:MAG: FMN-binding protein [Planctomycetota bacterium]
MIRVTALRMYRLVAILLAAWLLHLAERRSVLPNDSISLNDVRTFFPDAHRLSPLDERAFCAVWNSQGERLGNVLATSPNSDNIIGYSGASNLLAAIDPQGRVVGVKILWSGDTPAHVRDVERHNSFWRQFVGWAPDAEPLPKIDGVSGSTLTSLAMTEAVERRLRGHNSSRRFPQPMALDEVRTFFPRAAEFKEDPVRSAWFLVLDNAGLPLGYVVRTAPASDNVRGYKGPTESMVAVAIDRQTILGVRLRTSFDTPDYVDRVRDDVEFLALLANHRVDDWPAINFRDAGIEGVSGATQTSFAVAEGLRRRFRADESMPSTVPGSLFSTRNLCVAIIAIGGLIVSVSRLRSSRRFLTLWHIIAVAVLGIWFGDLLSLATFAGWGRHGIPFRASPGIVLLAVVALVMPWGSRRNVYCQHICPHGIVQGWLGRFRNCHVAVPERWRTWLGRVPAVLLVFGFLIAVAIPSFDLTMLEPFDAWVLKGAAIVSAVIAVAGLAASIVVSQAYCRFGCPTGALLKFIGSGGRHDRFSLRDTVAGLLLVAVGVGLAATELQTMVHRSMSTASALPEMSGRAFGTTWRVRFRTRDLDFTHLRERIEAEVQRIEGSLSHWSPGSATAEFNGLAQEKWARGKANYA